MKNQQKKKNLQITGNTEPRCGASLAFPIYYFKPAAVLRLPFGKPTHYMCSFNPTRSSEQLRRHMWIAEMAP